MTATASSTYVNASDQCLVATLTNAPSALPASIVGWVIRGPDGVQSGIGGLLHASNRMLMYWTAAGTPNFQVRGTAFDLYVPFTGGVLSKTEWTNLALVSSSTTDHKAYRGAVANVTSTTDVGAWSATPSSARQGCWYSLLEQTMDGSAAFLAIYDRDLSANEITEVYRNPFSVPRGLIWMPNLLVSGAAVGDYYDLSASKKDPSNGIIPTSNATSGPPIHFFAGGM